MFLVVCVFLNQTVHCTQRTFCTFTIITTLQLEAYTNVLYYKHNSKTCQGFGGLEVACWPLVPKFAGSNPAEVVGFFRAKKSSARLPSEGQ